MRSFIRLLLACLACGLTAGTAEADLLLAINKGDNTLAIVDAATLRLLGTAPVGPDPHEVVVSPDGKLAYITNYNAGNGFQNTISVVDLVARKALPPIEMSRVKTDCAPFRMLMFVALAPMLSSATTAPVSKP